MAKRIYVGGLPYAATEQDLNDLFSPHGNVTSATVITDKYTGQAKGFGFIEMSSDSEALAAINALNGTLMGGRTLTVNEARPREDRPRSGGGGGYGGGGYGGGGGRGGHSSGGNRGGYGNERGDRW
jgi:RNA recognition motif-containing protein